MSPFFSIIIPVFNEMDQINQVIRHLSVLSAGYDFEIIVVDGNPAGNTIQAIDEIGWRMPVKKLLSPKGRGIQMNTGAAHADGKILLFLHADTILNPNAFQDIESVIRSEKEVVGGAFDLGIDSPKLIFRIIERVSSFRSRITRIPYGDQAIFMKSGYFHKIGCFSTFPIMEDVDLMLRVGRSGGKIRIIPEKVRTSSRRWEKEGVLFCTFRNWLLIMLFFCGVSPAWLAKYYT
ncbi:MAG: glycosyltransferase [Desulfobacteraceae bacterium]|nr:MAG: glycosyltransferase [Desulfobacteraceae bacterium]